MNDHRDDVTDLEERLRAALHHHSRTITPTDRLEEIRSRTTGSVPIRPRSRITDWFVPLAAAASVLLVTAIAWFAWLPGSTPVPPGQGSSTSAVSTGPSISPTTPSPSDTGSSTSTGGSESPGTAHATVPVYFVGAVQTESGVTWKLYREFVLTDLTATATPTDRVAEALRRALNAQAMSNAADYLQPWSGTALDSVTVAPDLITITLTDAGPDRGFDAEQQRLAVQELVWTAQAAYGQGRVPVTFAVTGGATRLFGRFPTSDRYDRPDTGSEWRDAAPVWITTPSRDQQLSVDRPVTVTGLAIAEEAQLGWEVRRGSTVVKAGTASSAGAAPAQTTYSIDVGSLPAGDYQVTVWTVSLKDGSRVGANATTFSVR